MLVQIEVAPTGPLAVIAELPDARLAILEGLNGIGKTLAIRLLQICTGTLPYRQDSAAWASLRDGLGTFKMEISGLKGAQHVAWKANSADWDKINEPEPTSNWFSLITIDSKPATLEDVQRLLSVHRLAGDEGIIETFASLADEDAAMTRRWIQRYATEKDSPLVALEGKAARSLDLLSDWSADRYERITVAAAAATDEFAFAKAAEAQARSRHDLAVNAMALRKRLLEIRLRTPELSRQLSMVDKEIGTVQREREALHQQLSAMTARLARAEPLQKELKNARRTLERNRAKLTDVLSKATISASRLGLRAEPGPVAKAMEDLQVRLESLRAEQTSLDAAPMMRELLDQVGGELADAEERGLAEQVALDDPETNLKLTVAQTRVGMVTRRTYLEGQPPPPQAQAVERRLAQASKELELAQELSLLFAEVSRLRQLVAMNEERVNHALQQDTGPVASQAKALEENRRSKDEALMQLAVKRAELAQQLGSSAEGANEQALSQQLATDLARIGIPEPALEEEVRTSEQAAVEAQVLLAAAQERRADTQREVVRANTDLHRAASALAEADELRWVRRAVGSTGAVHSRGRPDQLLLLIEGARKRIETVIERLGNHRIQLAAIDRALQAVARGLRGQNPDAVEYVEQIQRWLGSRFSDWFNIQRVRQELLPQSDGDIEVDLLHRQVTWRQAATKRSRPLEAFSSGEQAFAYTRARLALLDETRSRSLNRLIVLDEFGAFIAHDRLQGLLAYLQERTNGHPNDQVLIVLPISQDYAEMSKSAIPSEATRLKTLAGQIEQRKYAVRVLVQ
ncbi:MAG TPA: hypothetical protein VKU44_04265 [Terriglobia bacterium]|nr:hypothetical protein [Terriglobia bacterium]